MLVHVRPVEPSSHLALTYAIPMSQLTFALEFTYAVAHLPIKISILLLYKSVLTLNNPRFNKAWYILLLYNIALTFATLLGVLFLCSPLNYQWDRLYRRMNGRCELKAAAISMAALSTVADVALLILPIPTLWNLQMPYRQKMSLCGNFLLGGL